MSDYTPTTEEVKSNYLPPRTEIVDADEQFDRWLAEVKAQAWAEGLMAMKPLLSVWPKQHHLPLNPYRQGEKI